MTEQFDQRRARREEFRQHLWHILHHGHGHTGHAFNFLFIILILLSIAILPLEIVPRFTPYHRLLHIIEIITTAFFTVDYALRIYAAPSRLRYIFSFFGIVDLLSIAPFYLGLIGTQYIRALRLVRLLRFGEIRAAAAADETEVMEHGVGIVHGQEDVQHVVTRHPLYLLLGSIPSLLATTFSLATLLLFPANLITITAAASLFVFALVFLWKAWLDYSYDVIYVTSRRLIFQNQHLLGRSINQVSYHSITNVKPSYTGIVSYLMGFGTLTIETAADQLGHFELAMVQGHEKAAHLIMQRCFEARGMQPGDAARGSSGGPQPGAMPPPSQSVMPGQEAK